MVAAPQSAQLRCRLLIRRLRSGAAGEVMLADQLVEQTARARQRDRVGLEARGYALLQQLEDALELFKEQIIPAPITPGVGVIEVLNNIFLASIDSSRYPPNGRLAVIHRKKLSFAFCVLLNLNRTRHTASKLHKQHAIKINNQRRLFSSPKTGHACTHQQQS